MTTAQRGVLRLIEANKLNAFVDRCAWNFRTTEGEVINRRTVRALKDAGLVELTTYSRDGAAVHLTEAGRQHLAKFRRPEGRYNVVGL